MQKIAAGTLVLACLAALSPAEVVDSAPGGFTVRITENLTAPPAEVYRRFVQNVGDWWSSAHTFSHDAHNLSIEERVGGCFCEKYPAGGGVRHLQVNHLAPGKAILLSGGLGPLASQAVTGSMEIQFSAAGTGTKLVMTYAVGGYMPAGLNTWAAPVNGMLSEQFTRFRNYVDLGKPELSAALPPRPKILGIGHISLFVHDIEKSRQYYKDFLGYGEPFKLDNPDGSLSMTFIKVNDHQYIELSPEKAPNTDRLNHISIEVDDAEAMRLYLKARGIPVPDKIPKGRIKNSNFNIKDPDGHTVEVVQYEPDGFTMRENGKFMDGPRISTHMTHLGIIVGKLEPAMKFYGELLGFSETWRGSRDGKVLNWVNMKVPDGTDYLEFMLYDQQPTLTQLGTSHHICLEVQDLDMSLADLNARPAKAAYTKPLEIRTGINRKRQMNLYDPDGTRSELMESRTIDGRPTPSSTAAPPR